MYCDMNTTNYGNTSFFPVSFTTSQVTNPTEFVSQPTSTPEPTPSPEPLCERVATSCKELYQCNPALPSGYYNITTPHGAKKVFCVVNTTNYGNTSFFPVSFTTSQVTNPTEFVSQPTSTPEPTPSPEPLCEHIATSCKELYQCNPALPSGYYNITTPQGVERVYCDMNTTNYGSTSFFPVSFTTSQVTNPTEFVSQPTSTPEPTPIPEPLCERVATSCKELYQCNPALPSGYYNITTPHGAKRVFCVMNTTNYGNTSFFPVSFTTSQVTNPTEFVSQPTSTPEPTPIPEPLCERVATSCKELYQCNPALPSGYYNITTPHGAKKVFCVMNTTNYSNTSFFPVSFTTSQVTNPTEFVSQPTSTPESTPIPEPLCERVATSCKELYQCNPALPSGYYNITTPHGAKKVFCVMNTTYYGNTSFFPVSFTTSQVTNPTEFVPQPTSTPESTPIPEPLCERVATSCKELYQCNPALPSGYYNIATPHGAKRVYCVMNTTNYDNTSFFPVSFTTSQVTNPTEFVSQPTSTPEPTPSPEPLCERVATSCKELYQCNPALPSGYYNITTPQGVERVYCDMNTTNYGNTSFFPVSFTTSQVTNPTEFVSQPTSTPETTPSPEPLCERVATSCKELYQCNPALPSGYYNITTPHGAKKVFCVVNTTNYGNTSFFPVSFTTSQVTNPTEFVSQPTSTPEPTPIPEPLCEHIATSCKELYQCNPALPSGYYNITTPQGVERVYCDMNTTNYGNTSFFPVSFTTSQVTNPTEFVSQPTSTPEPTPIPEPLCERVATSCKELYQCNPALPSGYYNITTPHGAKRVFCVMNTTNYGNTSFFPVSFTTSQVTNPTEFVSQPTSTPEPTPIPEPLCERVATSCKELYQCNPAPPSGYYNITTPHGAKKVFCVMNTTNYGNTSFFPVSFTTSQVTNPTEFVSLPTSTPESTPIPEPLCERVATSCKELYQCNPALPSGYYNITTPHGAKKVFCVMNTTYYGNTSFFPVSFTTPQVTNPTEFVPQPTSTPEPTPSPEPLCEHVATSCKELHQCNPALPSGYYNITTPQGVERVYCDMNTTNYGNTSFFPVSFTTSQVTNPTEFVSQPTSTPEPTPSPEPLCERVATSCKELYQCNPALPSGYYNITTPQGVERVYCVMNTTNYDNTSFFPVSFTTSQVTNPTEFVPQPTSTPEPTPIPEPLCERVATSCKELYQCNPALPSGYYNITTPQGVERVYCVMNTTNYGNTSFFPVSFTTSQATNPTEFVPQPTSTPEPTPSPEPLCEHVATSCKELYQCNPALPSGYYNITTPQGAKRVYCMMNTTNYGNTSFFPVSFTTSQATNPTEFVSQPTSTPEPTPSPEPLCERVATSCKELYQCNPALPSGYYNITTPQGAKRVYCDMNTTNCGYITGGWMRAAYIDMTNENNTCPQGLTYTVVDSTRMCTRSHTGYINCSSVTFPTHGVPYTKVCGRARGYQFYATLAFFNYHHQRQTTLDSAYVLGLSVTYGSPRSHIWTFAAGVSKDYRNDCCTCPCASPYPGLAAPSFVGEKYFCESGNSGPLGIKWYLNDPLWDSQECAIESTCCDRGGPWFTTTLSQEVSDDIEVRICSHHPLSYENIGVDELEIYIY